MSQKSAIEPGYCPATYLDPKRVGEILLRVIPPSAAAGHEYPRSTLEDYCRHLQGDAEIEFVTGMLSKSTPELAERWYGGMLNASRIASNGQRTLPSPGELQCPEK
jgi:hypothetical protein